MTTTMEKSRAWHGWPLFSYGFRPFFLFGALHAALMVALWVPWFLGLIDMPSAFAPVTWHIHELLFGYVPAIIAGFLLTAIPNWTGRLPVVGWPLVGLVLIWFLGRVMVAFSDLLPMPLVVAGALAFTFVLVALFGREIVAGKNWRNLKIIAVLIAFLAAQVLFYYEAFATGAPDYAVRAGIALIVQLILIVGGRVVPSFTRNWLKRSGALKLPSGFGAFDQLVMIASGAALAVWGLAPILQGEITGAILMIAGGLNLLRQIRWHPLPTWREPLVAILHVAFFTVSAGFLMAGFAAFQNDPLIASAAIHCWTVGGIGGMTLAMMTRASRGHTGQSLHAPLTTSTLYALIVIAVLARILAGFVPDFWTQFVTVAGLCWFLAFAGFGVVYGPMLLRKREGV